MEALIEALAAEAVRALPVFVSSLKDPGLDRTVEAIFAESRAGCRDERTGFAGFRTRRRPPATVLESGGAPVLQVIFPARRGRPGKLRLKG